MPRVVRLVTFNKHLTHRFVFLGVFSTKTSHHSFYNSECFTGLPVSCVSCLQVVQTFQWIRHILWLVSLLMAVHVHCEHISEQSCWPWLTLDCFFPWGLLRLVRLKRFLAAVISNHNHLWTHESIIPRLISALNVSAVYYQMIMKLTSPISRHPFGSGLCRGLFEQIEDALDSEYYSALASVVCSRPHVRGTLYFKAFCGLPWLSDA